MEEAKIVNNIPIKIDEMEVLRYLGCNKNASKNNNLPLLEVIRKEIGQVSSLLDIKGIYRFLFINSISGDGVITLKHGNEFILNGDIIKYFKNSQCLLFAIITIGADIEYTIKDKFEKKQNLQAMVLDAIGTVAVKTAGQWLNHFLEEEIKDNGFQFSRYFEPGSGDWDISEQEKVFAILQPEKIGITLNRHCMMHPVKTLSWIRGMGRNLVYSHRDEFSCEYCTLLECSFRKTNTL